MTKLSSRTHAIIGLVVGVVLLFAPNIFGFSDVGSAAAVARWVGVFIIVSELLARNGLSPIGVISMPVHLAIDYVTGLFLAVSPWLFGFADEGANAWVPHFIVGLLIIGYAAATNPALSPREASTEANV